jgi:heme exporter protein D
MVRSRSFVAVSLVTAASLAVSSVAAAAPMLPAVSVEAAKNTLIQKVDDWRDNREQKRIQWERNYHEQRGPERSNRSPGPDRDHKGSQPAYRGPERGPQPAYRGPERGGGHPPQRTVVVVRPVPVGPRIVAPPHRRVLYRNIWVVRPYGHWYSGYGYHYHDDDAYRWLAFTAITVSLLTLLTVAQQRAQEQAQIDATTAPVGSTITWNDANAAGSVSILRDGHSADGQYCREYQQTVTVGGRSEQAYGTACMQPDGAWHIVSTQQ